MSANTSSTRHLGHPLWLHQDSGKRNHTTDPLKLIQLTDPHLFAAPQGRLLGITTRRSFESVLEMALERSSGAQALVLTGDLVHDESTAGYRYLHDMLNSTGLPYFCTPGNHDQQRLMDEHLGAAAVGPFALRRLEGWNLVFLNSSRCDSDGGHLKPEQIAQLEDLLADDRAPTLLFMHHHPIPVQSDWMDGIGIDNGDSLIATCDRNPQVKGIIFGHIHQEFSSYRQGYQILGTPSTCIQFLPRNQCFALDSTPPGYRTLSLHADGRLETEVQRLDSYEELPIYQAQGY
ncbi:Calcineurin phosphoesterase domain protein [Thiorhodococcus drewsii AZ1]|uniref:Calcineurin phosphoesterase domain protein n=1 Tax=Thiorhodococcus drewsii AZ1 TaxID=765913 RepID=G2DZH8_9GAMM|nr:Calcineurin phosphoesterase domain protein [Thiorhodococcus drewsii AZ1]